MQSHLSRTAAVVVLISLAACGGGGGGDGPVTPGANGLDYGAVGQQLGDAEGVAITGRTSSFKAGAAASISTGTITLDAGFISAGLDSTLQDGSVYVFGEMVTITNGRGDLETGEEVRITYDPNRSETYAGILDITISSNSDINGEAAYVFGFETDPANIDARSGSLIYSGAFLAQGSIDNSLDTSTEFEGPITVTVDFEGVGSAGVLIEGRLNNASDADLTGNLALDGNGFSGDIFCASDCDNPGASEIDATFYGPDADELGGVIAVNITVDGAVYHGAGGFVIADPSVGP